MSILGRIENDKLVIDYENKVSLDVFTDSASYRRQTGEFDSNVGYFVYEGDNLLHCKRKDYLNKTNNFGELKAIEFALKYINKNLDTPCNRINIYSDSLLSINSITTWLPGWLKNARNGVMYNSSNKPVANQDIIWKIIKLRDELNSKGIKIYIYFVRSHSPLNKLKEFHKLFCNDNDVIITLDQYKIIRSRNEFCDLYIKR